MSVYLCTFARAAAYIIFTSAHHFTIQLPPCSHRHSRIRRLRRCRFSYQPARTPPWISCVSAGRPCEEEHRKMRVIKGKIFLCPVIGGCRGNTRATSASNYFQTLRIERALPRTAGIARHIHFSVSPGLSVVTIQQPSSFLQGHPFTSSLSSMCWLLMVEKIDCTWGYVHDMCEKEKEKREAKVEKGGRRKEERKKGINTRKDPSI